MDHPYASFIDQVKKPGQYLGGEQGQIKKAWSEAECTICLAFPDLYEIGMSHLGFKILYSVINKEPSLIAERAYAVWHDMEAALRQRDVPLCSLENAKPLSAFDIVGFSLQYELTYTNILAMLDLGGIALTTAERSDADPLIVAGGPTATHPEPLSPFIDVFLIGDGEQKTAELMRTWAALRDAGVSRRERLAHIADLGGFYVPSLYTTSAEPNTGHQVVTHATAGAPLPVKRAILPELHAHPFPSDGPVASTPTVFDRVSVEVARGCTEGCRFCQAGMIYRPVRERDPQDIIDTITGAVECGGYDEASLTSLSTADYSAIAPLVQQTMKALDGKNVSLSVSSLRAYGLSEDVLDDMKTQRAGGLTFAPEAGTQRMRDVVNKNVTDTQLMETAERVFSRGWSKMKLYFMIGLPTEEDDDVLGIVDTGARALSVAHKVQGNKRARVTVSVSTHVPKPHTPFQWCAMDSHADVLRKQAMLREAAKSTRVQLRMHDSEGSWLEGVLARGDRSVANVIALAYDKGARFDSWDEQLDIERWTAAFDARGVDPTQFLGTIPVDATLPWSHIDVGLEPGFLAREYRRALKDRLSPPCGKIVGAFVHATNVRDAESETKRLVCYDCGVACDLTQMREERIHALVKLGAREPRTKTDSPSPARVDRRPYKYIDQGQPKVIRLQYSKLGRIAYASHLDLVRVLPRIFKRAQLPLFYTEGYRPKPKMTFAPALALGVFSLNEHLDLFVRAEALQSSADEWVARLNQATNDGITFAGATFLGPGDRSLNRVLKRARYLLVLPRSEFDAIGWPALLDRARTMPKVRRDVRGIGKMIDVQAGLLDVFQPDDGQALIARAGLVGNLAAIGFDVALGRGTTPRPVEVQRALGLQDISVRFVRTALLADHLDTVVSPLEVELLRQRTRKAS